MRSKERHTHRTKHRIISNTIILSTLSTHLAKPFLLLLIEVNNNQTKKKDTHVCKLLYLNIKTLTVYLCCYKYVDKHLFYP